MRHSTKQRILTLSSAAAALATAAMFFGAAPASAADGWTIQPTPNPSGSQSSQFQDISCTSATACTAVGYYAPSSGPVAQTLIESWDGNTWSIQPSPNASGPAGNLVSYLQGVSCTSASSCMAVGNSDDTSGVQTLAESWNGSTWTIVPTPNPSGSTISFLLGVSCFSSTNCFAVGYQSATGATTETLAEHWDGTSWSVQTTPDQNDSTSDRLAAISCASAARCSAVGEYQANSGVENTMVEHWNGSSWLIQPSPNPSGSVFNELGGISCTTATNCVAVGAAETASHTQVSLAEYWNGTTWVIQSTPNRPVAIYSELDSVSCTAISQCTAAGYFEPASGRFETVAEHWNGTSWVLDGTPNPAGARQRYLYGIDCVEHGNCNAVGYYQPESGPSVTLAVTS
jgi:hypothetical protein